MDFYSHVLVAPTVAHIPVGSAPSPVPRIGGLALGGLTIPYHSTPTAHLKHLTFTAMSGAGFSPSTFGVRTIQAGEILPVRSSISSI